MKPLFDAKATEVAYFEQQFAVLRGFNTEETIKLEELKTLNGKTPYDAFVATTARNFILGYTESMLLALKSLAGSKAETLEEKKKRITRDSNK